MPTFEAISSPVLTDSQRLTRTTAVVLAGTLLLVASSWIAVPMWPVPVTMQTYAVIVLGALLGARLGTLTVMAWLAEAAMGLPVLAHGAAGLAVFFGPTAGYLVSFPVIAAFTGWLADRKLDRNPLSLCGSMLAANAVNLGLGVLWLAAFLGWKHAVLAGFTPFWIGGLLKAFLATATVMGLRNRKFGFARDAR
jgi:biotin transport system substrate-specific component